MIKITFAKEIAGTIKKVKMAFKNVDSVNEMILIQHIEGWYVESIEITEKGNEK